MKIFKLIPILFILLSFHTVLALGVTRPLPSALELMRGESADFRFQIQAITSDSDLECTYSFTDMSPLVIKLDKTSTIVRAGSKEYVYGTVTIPQNAEIKTYSSELSVSCGAVETEGGGSQVRASISGRPFNVKVVELRENDIREIRPPEEGMPVDFIGLGLVAVLIVLAAYLYNKSNKKKTKVRPKAKSKKKQKNKPKKKRK